MAMEPEDVLEAQLSGFNGLNLEDLLGKYSSYVLKDWI